MAQLSLFDDLPEHPANHIEFREIRTPVWTRNKARLVAEYLHLFVLITKHGCYIDGFAGPKQPEVKESWAAELVIESEPPFLREFFLCDQNRIQIEYLTALAEKQKHLKGRRIEIIHGDFNNEVNSILSTGLITEKKATFCLIDQFTAECHWNTIKTLAEHKKQNAKIELLYFLASGWLDRALEGFTRNVDIPLNWWGRDDWRALRTMKSVNRALLVCDRLRNELGYRYAHPWPIYDNETKRVMFHMIHATDHPEAPKLMARAYRRATLRPEQREQLPLPLGEFAPIAQRYSAES